MVDKVFISLSGRNQAWFDRLPSKEKAAYLKSHPNSKFGKGTARRAKKAAEKAAPAKAEKKVKKIVATKGKRPAIADKPKAKPAKKASSKKKSKKVQRKKPEVKVHKDTAKLHEQAMKQKKAMIDKVIAPYARELGQLRNKRDSGGGLNNQEAARYKQLLETIAKLHKGRND